MPKKRRERDRPKASHDAIYNPNKRVLLSYESDDQSADVEGSPGTGHSFESDAALAHYQIATYQDDEDDDKVSVGDVEHFHAENETCEANGDAKEDDKEPDIPRKPQRSSDIRRNPATNLRPALGSLAFQWDGENESSGDDTEEDEAMAYLRAVRSERQTLPTVLRATKSDDDQELYSNGVGDGRGYLTDGAYIARPLVGPVIPKSARELVEPREAFDTALKHRFMEQRRQLHCVANSESIAALDKDHPTRFLRTTKSHAQWLGLLKSTVPTTAQVRTFEQDTVFGLLELVQSASLMKCKNIPHTASIWIWSLLSRLDDVGTMDNDQVSTIREFGKQAVLVLVSLRDPAVAQQLTVFSAGSDAIETDTDLDFAAIIGQPGMSTSETHETNAAETSKEPSEQDETLATLDMIITVIGDVFGQRDLLEFRRPWEADD